MKRGEGRGDEGLRKGRGGNRENNGSVHSF